MSGRARIGVGFVALSVVCLGCAKQVTAPGPPLIDVSISGPSHGSHSEPATFVARLVNNGFRDVWVNRGCGASIAFGVSDAQGTTLRLADPCQPLPAFACLPSWQVLRPGQVEVLEFRFDGQTYPEIVTSCPVGKLPIASGRYTVRAWFYYAVSPNPEHVVQLNLEVPLYWTNETP